MRPQSVNIKEVIEMLVGTCMTLSEALHSIYSDNFDEENLTPSELEEIDNEIFLCAECGWWCENSEMTERDFDETFCNECKPND